MQAEASGGKPPGRQVFSATTGIAEHHWSGVIWSRWSEAVTEAGYPPNKLQGRFDTSTIINQVVVACRHYGHIPTVAELKLYRRIDPAFPSKGARANHFLSRAMLLAALAKIAEDDSKLEDIAAMVATANRKKSVAKSDELDDLPSGNSSEGSCIYCNLVSTLRLDVVQTSSEE